MIKNKQLILPGFEKAMDLGYAGKRINSSDDFWGVDFTDVEKEFIKKNIEPGPENLAIFYNDIYQSWLSSNKRIYNLDNIDQEEYTNIFKIENLSTREKRLIKNIILKVIRDFYEKQDQLVEKSVEQRNGHVDKGKIAKENTITQEQFLEKLRDEILRGHGKPKGRNFRLKNKNGEKYRQKNGGLIKLFGGEKWIAQVIREVIKKIKQENNNDLRLLEQKISNDEQFIIDVTDSMMGKKMHSFYRSFPSREKKQALYSLVKKRLLNGL